MRLRSQPARNEDKPQHQHRDNREASRGPSPSWDTSTGAQVLPQQGLLVWEGRKGLPALGLPPGSLVLGRGLGATHAFLPSSQAAKPALLAPPKTSTAWSSHWIIFPWRWEVQLAKPRISAGASIWSHTPNCASSPTKACVASKRPPRVSWERAGEVIGQGWREEEEHASSGQTGQGGEGEVWGEAEKGAWWQGGEGMDAWKRFKKTRQGGQRDREREEKTVSTHGQPGGRMNRQESQLSC